MHCGSPSLPQQHQIFTRRPQTPSCIILTATHYHLTKLSSRTYSRSPRRNGRPCSRSPRLPHSKKRSHDLPYLGALPKAQCSSPKHKDLLPKYSCASSWNISNGERVSFLIASRQVAYRHERCNTRDVALGTFLMFRWRFRIEPSTTQSIRTATDRISSTTTLFARVSASSFYILEFQKHRAHPRA